MKAAGDILHSSHRDRFRRKQMDRRSNTPIGDYERMVPTTDALNPGLAQTKPATGLATGQHFECSCHTVIAMSGETRVRAHGAPATNTDDAQATGEEQVGAGPHPKPWPVGSRFDTTLLRNGDRRNVVDRYRYWSVEAITADLDTRRHPFHVAVENWQHDRNIGTVVRTANAFCASRVHIVGRRRWNRRGAMMTEVYQHLNHHATVEDLLGWARSKDLPVIGVDNLPGAAPLETADLPERCLLLFGQEGPGLSMAARESASQVLSIAQFGSTRSINAGVAAGIAMHAWIRRWSVPSPPEQSNM